MKKFDKGDVFLEDLDDIFFSVVLNYKQDKHGTLTNMISVDLSSGQICFDGDYRPEECIIKLWEVGDLK